MNQTAIDIVTPFIKDEEALRTVAYPDPGSPLGKLWHRTGQKPQAGVVYTGPLSGAPWTIGFGETRGVRSGDVWTKDQAERALRERLKEFQQKVFNTWPGANLLKPHALAALISLVYNRGTSLNYTDKRKEMRELGPAIKAADYNRMADLILQMRRHWIGKGLDGLITRREKEAAICRLSAYQGD